MVRREFVFFANESDDEADDNILLPFILLVLVLLVGESGGLCSRKLAGIVEEELELGVSPPDPSIRSRMDSDDLDADGGMETVCAPNTSSIDARFPECGLL